MTHTWSTDSYATYPQIHPGRGGRGAGDSVNGWGRKRVSLQPVVHRQPVSWPEEHDVTISVGVLGAGGGLLGLNWSEHASSRKGGGSSTSPDTRASQVLLWTERLLYCLWGLDVGHVGGAHVGPRFLSAGKQRQEIRLRATAPLPSSASSANSSCIHNGTSSLV